MNSVVITGATGFIGSHLARRLVKEGCEVHVVKRPTSNLAPLRDIAEKIHCYDVQEGSCRAAFAGRQIDAVFHLAAEYGRNRQLPSALLAANTLFPLRLLEDAAQAQTPTFINADTCFSVDYPYLQSYTVSKKQFVAWGKIVAKQFKLGFINLQLQHPFGPGDRVDKFVPWLIAKCLDGSPKIELTAGDQRKDFIFISDVVEAFWRAAIADKAREEGFHHFECGRGESVSVRSFVEQVHCACQSQARLEFGALSNRPNEVMEAKADISRLVELGWRPECSLEDGVGQTVEAAKSRAASSSA